MIEQYGAPVERGRIIARNGDTYQVQSLSRDGVVTPFIAPVITGRLLCYGETQAELKLPEYTVGDMVYFFLFEDGKGAILTAL